MLCHSPQKKRGGGVVSLAFYVPFVGYEVVVINPTAKVRVFLYICKFWGIFIGLLLLNQLPKYILSKKIYTENQIVAQKRYSQIAHCYCIGVRNMLILQRNFGRGLCGSEEMNCFLGQFRWSSKLTYFI